MIILAINFGHDASLCLFKNGRLIDFCEVERESRRKHHYGLTSSIVENYLQRLNLTFKNLDLVVTSGTQTFAIGHSDNMEIIYGFSDKHIKFCNNSPAWDAKYYNFSSYIPVEYYKQSIREQKLVISNSPSRKKWLNPSFVGLSNKRSEIEHLLQIFSNAKLDKVKEYQSNFFTPLTLTIDGDTQAGFHVDHHGAHANYASYYSSSNSVVATLDGGSLIEPFASGGIYYSDLEKGVLPFARHQLQLGLIYDQVAREFGLDAGKLMGLAAYGVPNEYIDDIIVQYKNELKGAKLLHASYWSKAILHSASVDQFINNQALDQFDFQFPDRDYAVQSASNVQKFVQELYVSLIGRYCDQLVELMPSCNSVYTTGGFALNCPTNTELNYRFLKTKFIPLPGVGDTGLSIGAAVAAMYYLDIPIHRQNDDPAFPKSSLDHKKKSERFDKLTKVQVKHENLNKKIALELALGKVICVQKGRSEVGPRALGNRSIIAWAGSNDVRDLINTKKGRELWRPLAPICRASEYYEYFVGDAESSAYMLTVSKVRSNNLPAVTHVDNTARVQVISETNKDLFEVLGHLKAADKFPVIINTSFNIAGEPIVETTEDAAKSFLKMDFDYLWTEEGLFEKNASLV